MESNQKPTIQDGAINLADLGDRLLTAEEVAQILQVSKSFAYQLMKRNEIAVVRLGRSVRVRPEDLRRFIEGSVQEPRGLWLMGRK